MNDSARQIGYFCSLVPEEIITAAGMHSVRMAGDMESTSDADAYLYHNLCPYIKNVISTALKGKAKHLDGAVFTRSCDGMRRMYDVWKAYINTGYTYMLEVPKNRDELAIRYYASQLRDFAETLGNTRGNSIENETLHNSIKTKNKVRSLMRDIFSLQQMVPLPIKGSELFKLGLEVIGDGQKEAVGKMRDFCRKACELEVVEPDLNRPRLLISGSVMDKADMFELIEEAGADIPIADLCNASRYFERRVDEENDDAYISLSQSYLGKPHCPRTASPAERLEEINDLVKTYAIDGIVLTSLKFCDQHLYDDPYLVENLTASSMPVLFMENDYTFSSKSQMKVRVEAFIEVLNEGRR